MVVAAVRMEGMSLRPLARHNGYTNRPAPAPRRPCRLAATLIAEAIEVPAQKRWPTRSWLGW